MDKENKVDQITIEPRVNPEYATLQLMIQTFKTQR